MFYDAFQCLSMLFDAFLCLLMPFDIFYWLSMAFQWRFLMAVDVFQCLSMSFKEMSFEVIYRILIFAFFFKKDSLCRERRGKMTAQAIKKEADFEDDFTRPVLVLRSFPPLGK
jgi:hypothetical protein